MKKSPSESTRNDSPLDSSESLRNSAVGCAIYARVTDKAELSLSPASWDRLCAQVSSGLSHARSLGLQDSDIRIYFDVSKKRPALADLMKSPGQFKDVITDDLARISRDYGRLHKIHQQLRSLAIRFWTRSGDGFQELGSEVEIRFPSR